VIRDRLFWESAAVGAVLFAALLVADALCRTVFTAPAPLPPKLADAALVGTWRQEWAGIPGTVAFGADGTYRFEPDRPVHAVCVGQWWVKGGELHLVEQCFDPEAGWGPPHHHAFPVVEWTGSKLVAITHETVLDGVLCRSKFVLTGRKP
jgi:hypothetical protein